MTIHDIRSAEQSVMPVMSEEEFAEWRRADGARVVLHQGRFWEQTHRGFYQPIHWLARLHACEVSRPTRLCWGFRTSLHDDDALVGPNTLPLHLLTDVEHYDMAAIRSKRRNQLRKCRKLVEIVEVTGTTLLAEQGFEVVNSAIRRIAYIAPPTREEYAARIGKFVATHRGLILAGFVDGKLGGYLAGTAVEGTAYIDTVFIADEALPTQIGTGLVFDFVQACRRSGKVFEVVYGQHSREDGALVHYKEDMLFPVVHIPAKLWIYPVARSVIRRARPDVYYRLTGEGH